MENINCTAALKADLQVTGQFTNLYNLVALHDIDAGCEGTAVVCYVERNQTPEVLQVHGGSHIRITHGSIYLLYLHVTALIFVNRRSHLYFVYRPTVYTLYLNPLHIVDQCAHRKA